MKSKISFIGIFCILFLLLFSQISFAKYKIEQISTLEIFIDKTPPTINLKSADENKNYSKTDLETVIPHSKEIIVSTSDNVKISYNEYYYNSTNKDFSNIEANKFDSGKTFTDDGYYKIVSVDSSGNKTEIIILIDKTAPNVQVKYFKKGEENTVTSKTEILKVAGIKKYRLTGNVIDTENIEITENEENGIALLATGTLVYNESEFRKAIENKVAVINTVKSINFSKPIYINYPVLVSCVSSENALRYSGTGSFFIIQNRWRANARCNGN